MNKYKPRTLEMLLVAHPELAPAALRARLAGYEFRCGFCGQRNACHRQQFMYGDGIPVCKEYIPYDA